MPRFVNPLLIGPVAAAALPEGEQSDVWVKLMPAGTFETREGRGPFTSGDRAGMQKIVDASKAYAGATDLMVDYDHQSVFGAVPGVGGQAPAAGWIKQLEVRDDGIYGRIAWTASAAAAIKAGEYRYISPYFFADTKSTPQRVTRIDNAALVNRPALDLAVAASQQLNPSEEEDTMKKIAIALGLAEGASEDAILAAIAASTAGAAKIAKAAGLKPEASVDDVTAAVTALVDGRGKIAKAAGLEADATTDAVTAAIAASSSGADMVPKASFDKLSKDFTTLKTSIETRDADEAVTAAITAGKITPGQKDWATKRARADLADFQAFVASAPILVGEQLGDRRHEGGSNDGDPAAIAAAARAYQSEQGAKGINVSTVEAVAFVRSQKK